MGEICIWGNYREPETAQQCEPLRYESCAATFWQGATMRTVAFFFHVMLAPQLFPGRNNVNFQEKTRRKLKKN